MKIENNILNILDNCRVEGNVLYLPDTQLDRKTYESVNKVLVNIGGKWNRKAKGHVFEENPVDLVENLILTGEVTDIKKEFQYFPTPQSIAKQMIDMADIQSKDRLLEPSAGQGAIAELFPKENPCIVIELNEGNGKILRDKGFNVYIKDFLETDDVVADKIIMNPPFSKQQDVDHVMHAFNILSSGGTLVSIMSESPFFRENRKSVEFREFLEDNNAEIINLSEGAFKDSGTMVKTRIVKIKKAS